jgi:nicotinamidase-related amidase
MTTATPDTREGRHLPVMHCKKGSEGWQIYGQTRRALEEVGAIGLDKRSFGLDFSDPAVCAVFPAQVDAAELVGLVSNICVLSNAVALQSRWPDAQLTVDASLTDSFDRKLHEAALDVLEGIHVNVIHRGNGR